jgi:predicted AlkP superfamily phosphohydrolase/phosphomutase
VHPDRVLALGLDGFEISLADELIDADMLPVLAEQREHSARMLLDHAEAGRTGLGWEHFWSGLSPQDAHRSTPVEFDPATYRAWQEGARFDPFFSTLDVRTTVFDACYADLDRSPDVDGVAAWGAHDPGLSSPSSNPAGLLDELVARFGDYPSHEWTYANPWPSVAATEAMGRGLVEGVQIRSRAAQWLLTERFTDWQLGIVVVAEPHSAAEALWHGVDPGHPLHQHPSAPAARHALVATYEAVDRLVGELVEATSPTSVVVFSMGGMGPNHSDVTSMVLLPELVFRWALGETLLQVPAAWTMHPEQPPDPGGVRSSWNRAWYPGVRDQPSSGRLNRVVGGLPGPLRHRVREHRSARRARSRATGFQDLGWQPASWYHDRWPEMRAFALPSLYDGRVRINVRGREAAGLVEPAEYEAVCDEVEELVRDCVDPRTGEGVVRLVERPGRGHDPRDLGGGTADLIISWRGGAFGLRHPVHGLIGPVPYRRTGGHTGPHGFASVSAPGVIPGEHGVRPAFDISPTIVDLLGAAPVDGLTGNTFLDVMQAAPSNA